MKKIYYKRLLSVIIILVLLVMTTNMVKHYKFYYLLKYENDILDSQIKFIFHVLQNYCFEHGNYPASSEEFIKYINTHEKENYYQRSPYLQIIMRYVLALKVQKIKESSDNVYLYSLGSDYKNDSLITQINTPDYNFERWSIEMDFIEFLFARGDILLGQTTISCHRAPSSGATVSEAVLVPSIPESVYFPVLIRTERP